LFELPHRLPLVAAMRAQLGHQEHLVAAPFEVPGGEDAKLARLLGFKARSWLTLESRWGKHSDAEMLRVTREHFDEVSRSFPAIRDTVILSRARRAASSMFPDYSHGMRKKLSLAAALLPAPPLLFLHAPVQRH